MKSQSLREFANLAKKSGLDVPGLVMSMENALLDVGPKFLEGIACQESAEAFRSAQERVVRIGFAVNPPGVGEEVVSEKRYVTGIGGPEAAVASPHRNRQP